MKIKKIFAICFILFLVLGCTNHNIENNNYLTTSGDDFEIEELGNFSFIPIGIGADEILTVEYYGEYIRIPYRLQGLANSIDSEFGWFIFVDGLPQPSYLETLTGEVMRKSEYIHMFSLGYQEYLEFYIVFRPISGAINTNVSLMAATLLQPNFLPNSKDNPLFFPFHNLFAPISDIIEINYEITNDFLVSEYKNLMPISKNLIHDISSFHQATDISTFLRYSPMIEIIPRDKELQINYEDLIVAKNGTIYLQLLVFGGQNVTNRITFFVNHEPVQANGVDFFKIELIEGYMAVIDVTIEADNLNEFNSIYAIMMTTGDDFRMQGMFKSPSLLLVSEE